MREKVRPKMGKIDIDYQKLHDAFFKWQIKPKLTIHGDLYYEVREPFSLANANVVLVMLTSRDALITFLTQSSSHLVFSIYR